jgi:hypothetical protein
MSDAITTVRSFLAALARRDLDAAQEWLAPGFQLHVAGQRFTSLESFAGFSKPRQRRTKKNLDHCDYCRGPQGNDIVYARGTMEGEWNNGEQFAGIHWIDRFQFHESRITRLDIASDMTEFRPTLSE